MVPSGVVRHITVAFALLGFAGCDLSTPTLIDSDGGLHDAGLGNNAGAPGGALAQVRDGGGRAGRRLGQAGSGGTLVTGAGGSPAQAGNGGDSTGNGGVATSTGGAPNGGSTWSAGGSTEGDGDAGPGGAATGGGGTSSSSGTHASGGASSSGGTKASGGTWSSGGASTGGTTSTTPACNGTCGEMGCEDFTCVASPPTGWTGPFQLYNGSPASVPACPAPTSNTVFTGNQDVIQVAAKCSACNCASSTGTGGPYACGTSLNATSEGSCGGSVVAEFDLSGTACAPRQVIGGGAATFSSVDDSGSGGVNIGCAVAAAENPTIPAVTWQSRGLGCAQPFPQPKGCASGNVCAPIPSSPFEVRLCVEQDGDVACPSTTYTVKQMYYASASDTRTCSACTCKQSGNEFCSATVTFFSDGNCGSPLGTFATGPNGYVCHNTSTFGSAQLSGISFTGSATCGIPSTAGQPSGTLTPAGPMTVCCTP